MPEEWNIALLFPIHKKGSKLRCENYRGISLLNVTYKLFTKILTRRIEPYAEQAIGDYQSGFRRNRSTSDHIFMIRTILEKCHEYGVPVHQLYIDFKQAYDSIDRKYLYETLDSLAIPKKMIRLVKMTLEQSACKVKVQNELSAKFLVNRGLRQGDSLSCILFNLVLERVIRNIDVRMGTLAHYTRGRGSQQTGTIYNQQVQYMAYADDVALIGKTAKSVTRCYEQLEKAALPAGLKVNVGKTKYMVLAPTPQNTNNLIVHGNDFERVKSFKYLGSRLTEENDTLSEIRERISHGNRCLYSLMKTIRSRTLSRNIRERIYRSVIRPVVMYGSESWVLTKRGEQALDAWERKVLRKIYGPIQVNGEWRIRYNAELYSIYSNSKLSVEVRRGRLRWAGHLERMPENRAVKQIMNRKPDGRRKQGRPRKRWSEEVENDLAQLQVRRWKQLAKDRAEWTKVVDKARALTEL